MKKKLKKDLQVQVRLLDKDTPFAIREAFNQLRTNIMYSPNDSDGCPVYGVTSAEMGVGKSTITSNIALSFARMGKKVLLVDADMRRPTQYKNFNMKKNVQGLSELLSEIVTDDKQVLCKLEDGLTLITAGSIPPNPAALMLSKKLVDLIAKWRHEYDFVFIDLPPVVVVTDPLTIANYINGYIVVVTVNKSESRLVNEAIAQLNQVDAKVVGVVVNGVYPKSGEYVLVKPKNKIDYHSPY